MKSRLTSLLHSHDAHWKLFLPAALPAHCADLVAAAALVDAGKWGWAEMTAHCWIHEEARNAQHWEAAGRMCCVVLGCRDLCYAKGSLWEAVAGRESLLLSTRWAVPL